jgi:hypothetical protein
MRAKLLTLANRPLPPATTLTSWNAEGWYIRPPDSQFLILAFGNGAPPPQELVDLFREMEANPPEYKWTSFVRDVCFGFCYDPITYANH